MRMSKTEAHEVRYKMNVNRRENLRVSIMIITSHWERYVLLKGQWVGQLDSFIVLAGQ